jgi:hypothetical protein
MTLEIPLTSEVHQTQLTSETAGYIISGKKDILAMYLYSQLQ